MLNTTTHTEHTPAQDAADAKCLRALIAHCSKIGIKVAKDDEKRVVGITLDLRNNTAAFSMTQRQIRNLLENFVSNLPPN